MGGGGELREDEELRNACGRWRRRNGFKEREKEETRESCWEREGG